MNTPRKSAHHKPARPLSVTCLALAVFLLAVPSLWRMPYAINHWSLLTSLTLPFPLLLHVALGGLWGITWFVLALGLWRLKNWARRHTMIVFPAYQVYTQGWLMLFGRSDYLRGRLLFAAATAILASGLVLWVLARPHIRQVFEMETTELGNDH